MSLTCRPARSYTLLTAGLLTAGLLTAGLLPAIVGCADQAIRPDPAFVQQARGQAYSDREYALVLRDHVRYGLVDYDTLRARPESLLRYTALLSLTGPRSTPDQFADRSHAIAYYVNAYNALVMTAVLSQPASTPTMYDLSLPRLEEDYKFVLDGAAITLAGIQRRMLEVSDGDVRTILATSRAAMGTPRLPSEPIRPETLDRQLNAASADALDLPEILRIDHSTRSILVWQEVLRNQEAFVDYWKKQKRVRTFYLWNVLREMASPQQQRALQSAVGYAFRPVAFDRSLNRWERRADRPFVP